ncbi:ANKRD50, partial [Symbiodinium sp. KB8]
RWLPFPPRWLLFLATLLLVALWTCFWSMQEVWEQGHLVSEKVERLVVIDGQASSSLKPKGNLTMQSRERLGHGVLFVVRSCSQNYGFRVTSILRTWGQDIARSPSDGLMVVGDTAVQQPRIFGVPECGNDRSRALCCKTGYALQLAYRWLDDFAWFFVLDDDTYVNIGNLRQSLSTFSALEPQALGVLGCGPGFCEDGQGGFCGGGGYALSKAALGVIMVNSTSTFQLDLMSHLATEKDGIAYDDISVACLLKRHRVRLRSLHGLYAFGSQRQWLDEAYERAITARSPLPVSFHYIGPFLMEALHNRFARLTESRDTALPQDENIRSASPVPAELREIHLRGLQIFKDQGLTPTRRRLVNFLRLGGRDEIRCKPGISLNKVMRCPDSKAMNGWLNVAIGRGNHRLFVLLSFLEGFILDDVAGVDEPIDVQLVLESISVQNCALQLTNELISEARRANTKGVCQLLEAGAAKDSKDHTGSTAVACASAKGHLEIVDVLLKAGADPDLSDWRGNTALVLASASGHVEVVRLLLAAGAQMDWQARDGTTALSCAAVNNHVQTARFLLEAGADKDLADNNGNTPLILASGGGHADIVQLLMAAGSDKDQQAHNGNTALTCASGGNHADVVCVLVKAGADANTRDRNGETALHLASRRGCLKIVRMLLEAGAEGEVQAGTGNTPFFYASISGHLETARLLLEFGANKDLELLSAAAEGLSETVQLLLEAGADKDIKNSDGENALHLAGYGGHHQAVRLLLEAGTNRDLHDRNGDTPLINACHGGHAETVRLLLEGGADKELGSFSDSSPLVCACVGGHVETARMLLESGAGQEFALLRASAEGQVDIVHLLLEASANKDAKDRRGQTALHRAASRGQSETVRLLLAAGVDQNVQDSTGAKAIALLSVQWLHLALCIAFARGAVVGSSWTGWLYNLAMQFPLLVFVLLMHGFSSPGIFFLLVNHLYLIAINMTTNEMMNKDRYQHFWQEVNQEKGVIRKVFRNPFDKGSTLKNCLDFWWYRRRSAMNLGLREMEL